MKTVPVYPSVSLRSLGGYNNFLLCMSSSARSVNVLVAAAGGDDEDVVARWRLQ